VSSSNYTAATLVKIARERMKNIEREMDAASENLSSMREEHGLLYTIVKAYDDANLIGDLSSDTPSVTIGSHTIKVGRDF
jgi:hypothetical protein